MPRDRPVPVDDAPSATDDEKRPTAIGRRSYLNLLATTVAAGGTLATGRVTADSGGEDGIAVVDVDYEECYDASSRYNGLTDVYRVWNQRSGTAPELTTDVQGSEDACCAHHFDGDQMSANTVYPFDANHGNDVDEVYQQFRFHPNGMELADQGTFRFFWAGLRNGPTSSGGTSQADIPNGKDGWSVRLGFARRGTHDHPDGYTLFVYVYHMDQSHYVPELNLTESQVRMDEWNDVQCHQVLNTFEDGRANHDGKFRVWLNGELAFERTDYRWVSTPGQGIQEAGPHGYWWGSNQNGQSVYFDDHRIAVGGVPENEGTSAE